MASACVSSAIVEIGFAVAERAMEVDTPDRIGQVNWGLSHWKLARASACSLSIVVSRLVGSLRYDYAASREALDNFVVAALGTVFVAVAREMLTDKLDYFGQVSWDLSDSLLAMAFACS